MAIQLAPSMTEVWSNRFRCSRNAHPSSSRWLASQNLPFDIHFHRLHCLAIGPHFQGKFIMNSIRILIESKLQSKTL